MYIVMFEFVVKPGREADFLAAWPRVTQGIYLFKGSLGSRLHKSEEGQWIAYAQWPDRDTFERAAGVDMNEAYNVEHQAMRDALNLQDTRILYKMDVTCDYLQRRPFALE
ncbi:MAG: antibiotic biosynthesis monooxygenase [Alteromonadaceae bacterium]|nr:antibiotic biosynthesis monooxygenase [Alteromonadaceae bacterium]